jgi:hypothetical protein
MTMGCLVFDPATVVADEPLGPSQYRFVGTWAWWMASGGPALRRYCYLAENVIRVWVPADQSREWPLDRTLTGRRIWLAGSEEDLAAAGSGIPQAWPTGRWRAPYGDFFASDDGREPGLTEGGWQHPTPEFLAALPRDPGLLYERLRADSPGERPGYSGVFTYACDVLRAGLVPADLRGALYQALLTMPAVRLAEAQGRDEGRREVSLGFEMRGHRKEIFVDFVCGQFSGERDSLTRDTRDLKAGTVTTSTVVRVATVDRIGQSPDGDAL